MVTIYTTYFNDLQLCILLTECIYGFHIILRVNSDYFPNSINRLIFAIETHCVSFVVETESLNII
jgi:hypothetical protein